jgi:hypothetical protein
MTDCERCRGTGFESTSFPGPDGKDVEAVRRCTCQAADPAHAADRLLQSLRIPPRYEHCTFLTFEIGEGSTSLTKDARYMVMRYCGGYAERGAESANDKGLGLCSRAATGPARRTSRWRPCASSRRPTACAASSGTTTS